MKRLLVFALLVVVALVAGYHVASGEYGDCPAYKFGNTSWDLDAGTADSLADSVLAPSGYLITGLYFWNDRAAIGVSDTIRVLIASQCDSIMVPYALGHVGASNAMQDSFDIVWLTSGNGLDFGPFRFQAPKVYIRAVSDKGSMRWSACMEQFRGFDVGCDDETWTGE